VEAEVVASSLSMEEHTEVAALVASGVVEEELPGASLESKIVMKITLTTNLHSISMNMMI
jgi:hypothetical protein